MYRRNNSARMMAMMILASMLILTYVAVLVDTEAENNKHQEEVVQSENSDIQSDDEHSSYTTERSKSSDYEYKLVYQPDLMGYRRVLYFNGEVSTDSVIVYAKEDDFELYVKDGVLILKIGDNTVVTSEFSIKNN